MPMESFKDDKYERKRNPLPSFIYLLQRSNVPDTTSFDPLKDKK